VLAEKVGDLLLGEAAVDVSDQDLHGWAGRWKVSPGLASAKRNQTGQARADVQTSRMTLFDRVREIALVNSTGQILSWDQETYLPPGSADYRSGQLSYLAAHSHKLATSDDFLKALTEAEQSDDGSDPVRTANLREIRRESDRSVKIPTDFVARESTAQSAGHHAWIAARKASDFSIFAPHLAELVGFATEKANLWGFADEPYDALLEGFERGTSTTAIAELFDYLRKDLAPLSAQAVAKSPPSELPPGPYPVATQQSFNAIVAAEIGFDFETGRIDTTAHPFCTTLGPRDVRLTTRYMDSDFTSSLFGVMHEAGHGMYEQGLPASDFGLPSGSAVSLGIHESQSRLWENQVGRSREFWEKFYPSAQGHFPQLRNFPLEKFLRHIQRAAFSPIRVEADEATYDLHIILRFRIERMLLNREITVAQVPATWDELFHESFGSAPPDVAHGCLQDIHWSMGGIGYFPTYTLGNINAAQLFKAATAIPEIGSATAKADYSPLLAWLRENIHRHGGTLDPSALMKQATGKPPSTEAYLQHLKSRYL
jgi:carboxypeptidase Taq